MDKKKVKTYEYILLLAIVVIAVCAYRFGYVYYMDKTEAAKKETKDLNARIDELNNKIALKPVYEETIEAAEKAFDDTLFKYGPGNTPEKSIMFVTALEKATGGRVNTAAFSDDVPVFISSGTDENGNTLVTTFTNSLILNYEFSYEGLKKAMDFINGYPERMNVESFTASLNQETGLLNGTMTLNLFSAQAEGKDYVEPSIPAIKTGTDNIFGSIENN